MDVWDKLKKQIDKHCHDVGKNAVWSPFVTGNKVAAAVEDINGNIWTGINVETTCGVACICAERMALLKMVTESGVVVVKRILVCDQNLPKKELKNWAPCGSCREFLMQLSDLNLDCEFLMDWNSRETVKLRELVPFWWGDKRFQKLKG